MNQTYKKQLFETYNKTHLNFIDSDNSDKLAWFSNYVKENYSEKIDGINKETGKVLEIGCNKGFLLSSLQSYGLKNLHGIDLSEQDIQIAKKVIPEAKLECIDVFEYLNHHTNSFDMIVSKAVLEHIDKEKVIPLFKGIYNALKEGGIVLIDVPNMDWLFASHERYMDFTHENGFTQDSLGQIMRQFFSKVAVTPVDFLELSFKARVKLKVARYILGKLLLWADPQGVGNPIWARNIIGTGIKIT